MGFIVQGSTVESSDGYVTKGIHVSKSRSRSVSVSKSRSRSISVESRNKRSTESNVRSRSRSVEHRDYDGKRVSVGLSASRSRSSSRTRSRSSSGDYSRQRKLSADRYDTALEKQNHLSLKEKIRAARRNGLQGSVQDVQYLVEEGPLSFRSLGFFGGFFMILATALDFTENMSDMLQEGTSIALFIVASIIIQLEARPFHLQIRPVYRFLCSILPAFRYVWGRGLLYVICGTVQLFLFSGWCIACGIYFILLGICSIVFGYRASLKLCSLRNSLCSRDDIRFMFHSFDRNRDGYLDLEEFRSMMYAMEQRLSNNDFVAAFSTIDVDNNQMISYEDIEAWWEGFNDGELPIGASCFSSYTNDSYRNNNKAHLMA